MGNQCVHVRNGSREGRDGRKCEMEIRGPSRYVMAPISDATNLVVYDIYITKNGSTSLPLDLYEEGEAAVVQML